MGASSTTPERYPARAGSCRPRDDARACSMKTPTMFPVWSRCWRTRRGLEDAVALRDRSGVPQRRSGGVGHDFGAREPGLIENLADGLQGSVRNGRDSRHVGCETTRRVPQVSAGTSTHDGSAHWPCNGQRPAAHEIALHQEPPARNAGSPREGARRTSSGSAPEACGQGSARPEVAGRDHALLEEPHRRYRPRGTLRLRAVLEPFGTLR